MLDAREISRSLREMHRLLNAIRPRPALEVRLDGATVFMRPGEDSAFPSSAANRVLVYDPVKPDLMDTVRAASEAFAGAGVEHWFLEIGAGVRPEQLEEATNVLSARRWTRVRYPALARVPGQTASASTSLEIRRIGPADVEAHRNEIDAIWDKPGAAGSLLNAASRPENYAPVLGLSEGRAVAMGMLIHTGKRGGDSYLASGGTNPAYRNRGGQSAIIAERVRIAQELGCRMCVSETVLTVETSTSNLLKAGFMPVFEWSVLEIGTFQDRK